MKNLVFLVLVTFVALADDCSSGSACRPWGNGSSCAIDGRMDLRFFINIPSDSNYTDGSGVTQSQVTYAFCPKVDELQAFQLQKGAVYGAARYSYNGTDINPQGFTQTSPNTTIQVFGMGSPPFVQIPSLNDWSTAIFYQNTSACGGGPAIVNFLVLNITMKNGNYANNNFAQIGFIPTCDWDNKCLVGSSSLCIGTDKKMNCAQCATTVSDLWTLKTSVWSSYYGTDKNGKTFKSGSNNPLNFRQFSSGSAFDEVSKDVSSL